MLKDSEYGQIPYEWRTKQLEEVCEILDKKRKPIKSSDRELMQGEIPYYGASGIIDYVNDYIFDEELILLGEDGENIVSRNLPLAFRVSGKCWVNNHAHVFKIADDSIADIDYVCNLLEYKDCSRYVAGSAQPKITQKQCRSFEILVPPLPEQKKIAKVLSTVDEHIDEVDGMIDDLKELKKGLMQKLLTEGIGHIEFKDSIVGRIPVEWEVVKLGEKCIKITKGTTPTTIGYNFADEGVNFIKVESLTQTGGFDIDKFMNITMECHEEMSRSQIRDGDLLVSIAGTIGRSAVIKNEYLPANTNQALAIVRVNLVDLLPDYVHYLFSSSYLKKYIRKVSTVGAQPNMSLDQISKFTIPIPDIDEQRQIVTYLNSLEERVQLAIDEKDDLVELKKGLMQQLLTGKTRVKLDN